MYTTPLALFALTAGTTLATCIPRNTPNPQGGGGGPLTAAQLTTIDPKTATCADATFPDECRTAEQAVGPINKSFEKYNLKTKGEQAAVVALMLFESGSFKFNKNHYPEPGRPGQGTKNMQMANFNAEYAASLFGQEAVDAAAAKGGPAAVLDLVSDDEYSFASAAWFLDNKCKDEQLRQQLRTGSAEGWKAYLKDCVGTPAAEERDVIWRATVEAMGK